MKSNFFLQLALPIMLRDGALVILLVVMTSGFSITQKKDKASSVPFLLGSPDINSGLKREGYTIWGSSVIKGDDGKYHMFAACWPNRYPMSNWVTDATILHAVADTHEGEFVILSKALTPIDEGYWDGNSTYNPTIQKHKDTYILFYTGSFYTNTNDKKKNNYEALANKRIGIATSKSLYGPWKRYDKPILEPREGKWDAIITSNAAPWVNEDGSVMLIYKSWTIHANEYYAGHKPGEVNQLLGIAHADHYLGEYKRLSEKRIFNDSEIPFNSEDPFLWKQNGKYQLFAKIFEAGEELIGEAGSRYHATSSDGINWKIDTTGIAYSRSVTFTDGTTETFKRLERPQLLIQDGKPTHIYFAVLYNNQNKEARSICMPLIEK